MDGNAKPHFLESAFNRHSTKQTDILEANCLPSLKTLAAPQVIYVDSGYRQITQRQTLLIAISLDMLAI